MLCSHPHFPLLYSSLSLLGRENARSQLCFLTLASSCPLAHFLSGRKSHLTDGKELGMFVLLFLYPSFMRSTSYRKSTFSVLFCNLSCTGAAWCVCDVGGGSRSMLSVLGWVNVANAGCNISRPAGFSADRLLWYSTSRNEGEALICFSPGSLSYLVLNLCGHLLTCSRMPVNLNNRQQ